MKKLIRGFFVVNFLIEFSFCFLSSPFYAERDAIFLLRIRNRTFDKSEELTYETKETIESSAFDKEKSVIFHIHGYLENRDIKEHLMLSE